MGKDFIERLNIASKKRDIYIKRHNNSVKALEDYNKSLNDYRAFLYNQNQDISSTSIFDLPHYYFNIIENKLMFFDHINRQFSYVENYKNFFKLQKILYYDDLAVILMKDLFQCLKYNKLPSYEEALLRFKLKHNNLDFPINAAEYDIVEGNMVFLSDSRVPTLVTPDNVYSHIEGSMIYQSTIKQVKLKTISKQEIKSVLRALKRKMNLEIKQSKIKRELESKSKTRPVDSSEIRKSILNGEFSRCKSTEILKTPDVEKNKFYIYFKISNLYKMYYSRKIANIVIEPQREISISCKKISITPSNIANIQNYFPTDLAEKLFALTGGSITLFNEICELISSIQCNENILKKFHVLWANDSASMLLLGILTDLYTHHLFSYDFKSLCKIASIPGLINCKLDNIFLAIIEQTGHLPRNEALDRFRKIITSEKVSATDSMLGKIYYTSNLVCIYPVPTGPKLKQLKESLGPVVKVYDFSQIKIASEDNNALPPMDIKWAKIFLAAYGLKRIAERKWKNDKKIDSIPPETKKSISIDLVPEFIRDNCAVDKTYDAFADDLHGYYKEYVRRYSAIEPLSRVMFVKRMKELTNFEYKRPHHNFNGSNKYAFIGLRINLDAVNQQPEQENSSGIDSKKEVFFRYIKSMSDDLDISVFSES